jgi:hypothetical protein
MLVLSLSGGRAEILSVLPMKKCILTKWGVLTKMVRRDEQYWMGWKPKGDAPGTAPERR